MAELPALPTTLSLDLQDVGDQPAQLQNAVCQLPKEFGSREQLTWYRLPKVVLQGAQNLVHILTELRAPDSGWPAQVPYTVQTVAPYISEEIYEFLESLRQFALRNRGALSVVQGDSLQLVDWQQRQLEMAGLMAQLQWEVASSSYETMRLLKGIRAKCYREQTDTGTARLVLVLKDTVAETAVDVVRRAVPKEADWLEADLKIQVEDGDFCQVPIEVSELRSQIEQHLQQNNPILKGLLKGVAVNLLLPGRRWLKTVLSLSLQIEFVKDVPHAERGWRLPSGAEDVAQSEATLDDFVMPEIPAVDELDDLMDSLSGLADDDGEDDLFSDWALNNQPMQPETNGHRSSANGHHPIEREAPAADSVLPSADLLQTWITVSDEQWVQNFAEMIARQTLINQLPLSKLMINLAMPQFSLDRLLNPLVQRTCQAVQIVHGDVALFKQNFFQHPIFLKDLLPRLMWYVNRSAAAVMQLVDGVYARMLEPTSFWQWGRLRLLTTLHITTDRFERRIDLGTGKVLANPPDALPRSGMVITPTHALCPQPQSVAQIEHRLYRILRQTTPEIDWLLKGTHIDLHLLSSDADMGDADIDSSQLTGGIQLGLALEFIPAPPGVAPLMPATTVETMAY